MVSRILSGIITAGCLAFVWSSGVDVAAFQMVMYVGFCLLCIWFSEAMGDFVGGRMTGTTPDWMVAFVGWFFLLSPIVWLVLYEI